MRGSSPLIRACSVFRRAYILCLTYRADRVSISVIKSKNYSRWNGLRGEVALQQSLGRRGSKWVISVIFPLWPDVGYYPRSDRRSRHRHLEGGGKVMPIGTAGDEYITFQNGDGRTRVTMMVQVPEVPSGLLSIADEVVE